MLILVGITLKKLWSSHFQLIYPCSSCIRQEFDNPPAHIAQSSRFDTTTSTTIAAFTRVHYPRGRERASFGWINGVTPTDGSMVSHQRSVGTSAHRKELILRHHPSIRKTPSLCPWDNENVRAATVVLLPPPLLLLPLLVSSACVFKN